MSHRLQIILLGEFHLHADGCTINAAITGRIRALLGYLLLRRGVPQLRSQLAYRFWPDSSEQQALTNLRHLLHELRQTVPELGPYLRVDGRTIEWRADVPCDLDIVEFEAARRAAQEAILRADQAAARTALERAALTYRGDLLPGCEGEWIEAQRETLRQEYGGVLDRLVELCEAARDYRSALQHAQRLQQLDPLRETTCCTLMRLHLLSGDRAAALHVYQECVAALRRELQVGPARALRELRERVLGEETESEPHPGDGRVADSPGFSLHGRNPEWNTLRAAWRDAAAGRARMVALLGEAGIGKTRLGEELCVWVERQGGVVARTRSYAAEGRLAYAPVAQWLRSPLLKRKLPGLDAVWLTEVMRVLPELRLEFPELSGRAGRNGIGQRHHLFEALARAVLAHGGPLLLWLDDLQWTDQETMEWLRFLMHFAPAARLLLVAAIRSEELLFHEPLQRLLTDLGRDDQVTEIELEALGEAETEAIAREVAGRELDRAEVAHLYAQTEGNPLFVVESVRAVLGTQPNQPLSLAPALLTPGGMQMPPKVRALFSARLAQLSGQARELAGVAAVIGRTFTFEVLMAVYGRSEEELVQVLEELGQRRIVHEYSNRAYDFTHAKLREVAYAEMSSARRRMLHRRAAEALKKVHGEPEAVRLQVAAHLEASGQTQ